MSFVFFKVSGHCFLTFVSVDELKQNTSGNKQVEFENKVFVHLDDSKSSIQSNRY